jgi:hypothetical protein
MKAYQVSDLNRLHRPSAQRNGLATLHLNDTRHVANSDKDLLNPLLAAPPLSPPERRRLVECERVVQSGLAEFFEVGNALLTIREQRLYRDTHSTFEGYCNARWGFGRSYAWRVMGAAQRIKLLPVDDLLPKPTNEFQVRPLLKLKPEEFPKAWKEVVEKAPDGKITTRLVETVAKSLCHGEDMRGGLAPNCKPPTRSGPRQKLPLGQVLALLHDIRRSLQKGQVVHCLEVVDRVEQLLFERR